MIEVLEAALKSENPEAVRQAIADLGSQSDSVHVLVPLINLALKNNFLDVSLSCFEKALTLGLPEQQISRFINEPYFEEHQKTAKEFLMVANGQLKNSLNLKVLLIKTYMKLGELNEAIELINTLLNQYPHPELLSLLSDCYAQTGDYHSAKAAALLATELAPSSAVYLVKLAVIEKSLQRYFEAVNLLSKAIELEYTCVDAHIQLAFLALFSGQFTLGWQEYEWRFKNPNAVRWNPPLPLWEGNTDLTPHSQYHLLVWVDGNICEQILFLRLITRVHFKVTLKINSPVKALIDTENSNVKLLPSNYSQDYSEFDGFIALGSMAQYFFHDFSDLMHPKDYTIFKKSKPTMKSNRKIRVGFSWKTDAASEVQTQLDLRHWHHLLSNTDCEFVALESDVNSEDLGYLKTLNVDVNRQDSANPLIELSSQLNTLDLLITVDNVTVHLAGALGIPTILFLPPISHWYWFSDEHDACWYSSVVISRTLPTINCSGFEPSVNNAIKEWQKDSQQLVDDQLLRLSGKKCDSHTTDLAI